MDTRGGALVSGIQKCSFMIDELFRSPKAWGGWRKQRIDHSMDSYKRWADVIPNFAT